MRRKALHATDLLSGTSSRTALTGHSPSLSNAAVQPVEAATRASQNTSSTEMSISDEADVRFNVPMAAERRWQSGSLTFCG
jgi:hypothetical protein